MTDTPSTTDAPAAESTTPIAEAQPSTAPEPTPAPERATPTEPAPITTESDAPAPEPVATNDAVIPSNDAVPTSGAAVVETPGVVDIGAALANAAPAPGTVTRLDGRPLDADLERDAEGKILGAAVEVPDEYATYVGLPKEEWDAIDAVLTAVRHARTTTILPFPLVQAIDALTQVQARLAAEREARDAMIEAGEIADTIGATG